MKKIQVEQGSKQWHEYRATRIGASDIANIFGAEGAFKSRAKTLSEKSTGKTEAPSQYLENLFREGHEWEAVVREKLNAQGFNFQTMVVEHPANERFFASLDGIDVDRETILEVKSCARVETFNKYCEKIPEHYFSQVQWQMLCTGYAKTLLAFVYSGEVKVLEVKADPAFQNALAISGLEFIAELDEVLANNVPAPIQNLTSPDIERIHALKVASVQISRRLAEIDDEIKTLAERILSEHGATQISNSEISIAWVEREGSVDYKKIPELSGVDLAPYRKKGSKYIKVTI